MEYAEWMFESRRTYRRHLNTYASKTYLDREMINKLGIE